jgi:hypothetical protein
MCVHFYDNDQKNCTCNLFDGGFFNLPRKVNSDACEHYEDGGQLEYLEESIIRSRVKECANCANAARGRRDLGCVDVLCKYHPEHKGNLGVASDILSELVDHWEPAEGWEYIKDGSTKPSSGLIRKSLGHI